MGRPPPIRTDGSNAFARYSMQERVPRIARDVLERNQSYASPVAAAVERLARDIERDAPLPAPRPPAPDVGSWTAAQVAHRGETWLGTEWFFAELAFYRELVHACRFWETGRDPFEPVKEEELAGDRPWSRLEAALEATRGSREDRVASLLEECMWGNRVDLSYTVAASRTHRLDDDLLVDERDAAVPLLTSPRAQVEIIADNAGTELALDLALADAVLSDATARVTMHLKMQPMFVSDALPEDVWRTLAHMQRRPGLVAALAARLVAAFAEGRLALTPDPYWNGPRFLWDLPAHLEATLSSAAAVVLKGDANYRRLVGDALWPPATPLADVCGYMAAPVVCLRTMKSDPVVGLPDGLAERLDRVAERWRIDGQRGLLQTYQPRPAGIPDAVRAERTVQSRRDS